MNEDNRMVIVNAAHDVFTERYRHCHEIAASVFIFRAGRQVKRYELTRDSARKISELLGDPKKIIKTPLSLQLIW